MTNSTCSWEQAVCSLRKNPAKEGLVRSCYYDDPLIDAAKRFLHSPEWKEVSRIAKPFPGRMLDLGAGRGIAAFAFASEGWEVTALEPDSSSIVGAGAIRSLSSESGLRINVCEEWGESLPFGDNHFDLVYGRAVFHHARDLNLFCDEACRVLKKGGGFFVTREHVLSRKSDLDRFLDAHPLHHLYGGEAAYLLDDYLSAIEQSGLEIAEIFGPHSSAINIFPMDDEHHLKTICDQGGGRLQWARRILRRSILRLPGGRRFIERQADLRSENPGRLYSFLARKA